MAVLSVSPCQLHKGTGLSSGHSFPSSRHSGNTHTLLVYNTGRTAQLSSCHPASHQPSQEICWLQHPPGIGRAGMCTTADGFGEGHAPKNPSTRMGLGMCQAFECCTQSRQTSPGHFSQKSCPRCLCCTRITLDPLGRAGEQRRAPPKGNPRGSRLPNGVLPTLPSVMGSCSSHSLPVSPSPGRKEAVTSGSHPGRPQEGSLQRGSPAALCLHLPSQLSPDCSPAVGSGL